MHSNHQYTNAVHLDLIKTLPRKYIAKKIEIPEPAKWKLEVSKTSNKMVDIIIPWDNTEDRTCHYNILLYNKSDNTGKVHKNFISKVSVRR